MLLDEEALGGLISGLVWLLRKWLGITVFQSQTSSWHIHDKLGTHHCKQTIVNNDLWIRKRNAYMDFLWRKKNSERKVYREIYINMYRSLFIWIWTACHQRELLEYFFSISDINLFIRLSFHIGLWWYLAFALIWNKKADGKAGRKSLIRKEDIEVADGRDSSERIMLTENEWWQKTRRHKRYKMRIPHHSDEKMTKMTNARGNRVAVE